MADDGSASNPRDSVKSSGWNVSVHRRRQQAVMVSKKLRKLLIWAKRQRKVGTNGDDVAELMIDEEQPMLEAHTNISVEELKSAVQDVHLPKELDRKTIDSSEEIKITSSMASSSSRSRRYDVFPSFSGKDVRSSFLSHLLKELGRRLITTFTDHKIEISRPIGPELISAITESRIAIVVFSKKYASSKWCLNELVEIHKCYKEFDQMVIPIFYNVDPSEVRKQKGDFAKVFRKTCKGNTKDQKQKWMEALADVANLAGEDLQNWPDEAAIIEKITDDVFNKLITPSERFGDFVGIEAHLEAMNPLLRLESEEARMVGIVGPSGIGKTTIARALYDQLSSQFHHRAFVSYKRTIRDDYGMKLCWQEQFLSEIMGQQNIKIVKLGVMEQMLKHKKVLIFLDDVDDLELLKTLVGQTGWFGPESRIIVTTQDRQLLKAHEIDLIYEVEFPSKALALKMFCRSAFGQNSPLDGFMELAVEVTELAGNLPLGLSVLGSSLKGRGKDDWMEMLPRLRNNLDGDIEKTLKVSYDRLDRKDQELFLYFAFANLFNGRHINYIRDLLGDSVNINTGLKLLAEKSLIRITPEKTVKMHNLLQKLGKEIVRAESINEPGKRRFLEDVKAIANVLANKTGTGTVLGIHLNTSYLNQTLYVHKKAFKGMYNLQFLIIRNYWRRKSEGSLHLLEGLDCLHLLEGLDCLPSNLRLLKWDEYPSKCLPFSFKAEFLVDLILQYSKLEKLWEGTQPIGSLKKMYLGYSRYLKDIPDLSKAVNLQCLQLCECKSLVALPSSIQNAIKLRALDMGDCRKLESLPTLLNWESLKYVNLIGCFRLRNFPQIKLTSIFGYTIEVEDCLWNKNLDGVDYVDSLMRCIPSKFRPEHIRSLTVKGSRLEKLWEGVQSLGSLEKMDLSECGNLKEFPGLSKATNLWSLTLNNCKSLVTIPSTIGNLNQLKKLEMKGCTRLEVLPTDVNLSSLETLDLSGCQRLRSFPLISWNIKYLFLNDTAIEELPDLSKATNLESLTLNNCQSLVKVPSTIGNLNQLKKLEMKECTGLEVLPTDVNLSSLVSLDLSGCKRLRSFPQISWSIKSLFLNDTAIEEVPCCIEDFSKLTGLSMRGCKRLKNISPNIFRLRYLEEADFSECVEVIMALSDASVVETTEDHLLEDGYSILRWFDPRYGFKFNNCFNLDGDAQELILQSYFRPTILPGRRVPKYFTHQSYRTSLTVTLPQSSLSQEFLGFKACVVLEPITNPNHYAPYLLILCHFRGRYQPIYHSLDMIYNTDHLVLVSLKFPYKLDYNDVKFEFSIVNDKSGDSEPSPFQRIKGCGIRILNASPSPDGSDGSK